MPATIQLRGACKQGVLIVSTATATVLQMMESLPEPLQERVLDHLQEYLIEEFDFSGGVQSKYAKNTPKAQM